MARKSPLTAYEEHVEKLVKCLPMDDTLFITKLSACKLLPGDTHSQLKTLPTRVDKASYFLDHVIKPALDIDDTSSFDDLLSVMEDCGYAHVEKLACKIKSAMNKRSKIEPGMHVHVELRDNFITLICLNTVLVYICSYIISQLSIHVRVCMCVCACVRACGFMHACMCVCG